MLENYTLNWIANFIWGIADDVLRDVYVRGKYRDVILPMTVIRRLDAVLEETKQAVLNMKATLDKAGIANQIAGLCQASGQSFYNSSPYTLRDLQSRAKTQQLRADFEAYLDGFSPNVQEILEKFKFRNQIPTLIEADILGSLIVKFMDKSINLAPQPVLDADGQEKLPGLDNHAMGTIFEELIRRFNEENNEEAGEHFTPRDVITLMADLIFLEIADQIQSGTYLVYDGACGTGGMLTVAEERLQELSRARNKDVSIHLFGQESQPETYAISKADLLLKGDGDEAENFYNGSTLSQDAFPSKEFDFMLSNPPYGKSWKTDLERMGGKGQIRDPRYIIEHAEDSEFSLITRSSDGQLMFLVNKLSKMKHNTPMGSRIAEVHNGSSLFTGDAGQGESNIRRWILENDWLEAIIALPFSIFYNTGIATYIWILTNRKAARRKGKVQLIDATKWFKPLRKALGKKSCELSTDDIKRISDLFLSFEENEQSKIFPNEAFGYRRIVIERPLRLRVELNKNTLSTFKNACDQAGEPALSKFADTILKSLGQSDHDDFNEFIRTMEQLADSQGLKFTPKRLKLIQTALAKKGDKAAPVIKKIHKAKDALDPLRGKYETLLNGRKTVVEYEPDTELRDNELVPLLEPGGVEAFFKREVLAYAPDAWINDTDMKIGYEISFNRYFYKPQPLRSLNEIRADIEALEIETDGLLDRALVEIGGTK